MNILLSLFIFRVRLLSNQITIEDNSIVYLKFKEFLVNKELGEEKLEEIRSAGQEAPFITVIGSKELMFEEKLKNVSSKTFRLRLKPEEAYGKRDPNLIRTMKIREFIRAFNRAPKEGEIITDELGRYIATVRAVTRKNVIVDFNHPYAGKEIEIQGEIIKVLPPTASKEERARALLEKFAGKNIATKVFISLSDANRKMTIEIPPDVMTEMSSDERLGILGMRRVLAEYLLKYINLDEVIFIDHFIKPKEIIKETPVSAPVEAEKTSEDESTSSQPAKK